MLLRASGQLVVSQYYSVSLSIGKQYTVCFKLCLSL